MVFVLNKCADKLFHIWDACGLFDFLKCFLEVLYLCWGVEKLRSDLGVERWVIISIMVMCSDIYIVIIW